MKKDTGPSEYVKNNGKVRYQRVPKSLIVVTLVKYFIPWQLSHGSIDTT